MANLAELTDAYVAPDSTFPVEQLYAPSVKEDAITIRPVVDTPVIDAQVPERVEPRPEPMGLLDNFGMAGVEDKSGKSESKLIKKLFGLGGEERYQLWPEKVVRDALGAAGGVLPTMDDQNIGLQDIFKNALADQYPTHSISGSVYPGLRREDFTDKPIPSMPTDDSTWLGKVLGVAPVAAQPNDYMIDAAQSMAALAGSGGFAGATDATLGAGPFLRPALKYDNKIYKAPLNGQHLDALPAHLQETFHKQAMSGEDISHFDFGFMNHKGQFLTREAALDYAIKEGLVDAHAGQYGALTSTLLADSSKPGTAIEAMAKTADPYNITAYKGMNPYHSDSLPNLDWKGNVVNGTESRVPKEITTGKGNTFFSDDPKVASRFAEALATNGAVFPVKLKMDNPLVIDAKGTHAANIQFESMAKRQGFSKEYKEFKSAFDKGHDGIIIKNTKDEGTIYIPKEGHQIRSQFAKFDPANHGKNGLLLADSSKPGTAIEAMAKSGTPLAIKDAAKAEPVAPGMVRLYRGGGNNPGGPKWITTDRKYAERYTTPGLGYSDKAGSFLHYVDVPATDPRVAMPAGQSVHSFEAPPDIADRLQPFYRAVIKADSSKPGTAIEAMAKSGKPLKMVKATPNDLDGNPITDYHGNPINVTEDGKLVLYHRTNEQSKNEIHKTGKFKSNENTNETFFSDNLDSEYGKGFGEHVVAVKVDPKHVRLNDQFPSGENHYTVSNKYLSKANVLKSDNEAGAAIQASQDAFHGTATPGFQKFNTPNPSEYMPDRALGVHVSKDPEIANTFVKDNGGVYPVKIPHDAKFYEVKQDLLPYIEDKSTAKHARNVVSDQGSIEHEIYRVAYRKDPEMFARFLEARWNMPKADAEAVAKNVLAGVPQKFMGRPVKGLDDYIAHDGAVKAWNDTDKAAAVNMFKKELEDKGYAGVKYINTSPMETANAKDHTSYIVFDPSKHIQSKYNQSFMSGGYQFIPVQGDPFESKKK